MITTITMMNMVMTKKMMKNNDVYSGLKSAAERDDYQND